MIIKDDYIDFGQLKHAEEYQKLPEVLKKICLTASSLAFWEFGQKLITTSIWRKKNTDSGIHEAYRAVDFAPLAEDVHTYRLIEIINSIYVYDPLREKLLVAHPNPYHGTGKHIHFQCHKNTTIITAQKTDQLATQSNLDRIRFGK